MDFNNDDTDAAKSHSGAHGWPSSPSLVLVRAKLELFDKLTNRTVGLKLPDNKHDLRTLCK